MIKLKPILEELYPLHRTLVSTGMDEALGLIGEKLPADVKYKIETYSSGENAWTWRIPERYEVKKAYIESADGTRYAEFKKNPLHLVSYSLPIDSALSWKELEPHLYYNSERPWAIPWEFKYYERDWGFCLTKDTFDQMPRDQQYKVVIDAEFVIEEGNGLRVSTGLVETPSSSNNICPELIISSHVCHPMQANDDLAGVVTAIGLAYRLSVKPLPQGSMSVRFWFGPETIGSIAYFANNEDLIPNINGGIFLEMTGNDNSLILQKSRQSDDLIDRIATYVLEKYQDDFREGDFGNVIANDERVINGPGLNIPCISMSRWPYPEYHTSDDSPEIISESKLQEAVDVVEEIVRIYASNYIPKRTFKGPVFLSRYGLWVDWRENWDLNKAIEKIMMSFEGDQTIFDISASLGLDYWETREYIERFKAHGLIEAIPIRREYL